MDLKRLKELRKELNLSQEYVAETLGIKQQNYSRYENGDVTIPVDRLEKLALLYGTSIDYLIDLTDEKNPYKRKKIKRKK